jgi:1-acyl-sn-glycerol-3-phosphate acyltransferase
MASESAVPSKYLRPYAERSWLGRWWVRFSQRTVGGVMRCWCRVSIEGEAHIPLKGGVLLASNHISMLDALLIPYAVMETRGMQMVWSPAKEELFRIPVVRHVLLSWGSFPVRRGRGDLRTMRRIMALLRDHRVMLFPEGTRSPDGRLQQGQRTVGKFIYHARPVVVPTVVSGTNRILPKGAVWPAFRRPIAVRFGPPLDLQRYYDQPDSKHTAEAIVQEVMRAIATLRDEPPAVRESWPISERPTT